MKNLYLFSSKIERKWKSVALTNASNFFISFASTELASVPFDETKPRERCSCAFHTQARKIDHVCVFANAACMLKRDQNSNTRSNCRIWIFVRHSLQNVNTFEVSNSAVNKNDRMIKLLTCGVNWEKQERRRIIYSIRNHRCQGNDSKNGEQ